MSRQWTLYFYALATLVVGILVYVIDRPADDVYFLRIASRYMEGSYGQLHDSLPSFLHALAFSLAMIGAVTARTPGTIAQICGAWWLLEGLLEVIQSDSVGGGLSQLLPAGITSVPFLEALPSYMAAGTFDVADLIAAGFGCTLAFFTGISLRKPTCAQY